MSVKAKRVLTSWLPLAAAVSVLCLTVYGAVQQSQRAAANDPQIQLAEDAATRLIQGASPQDVVPSQPVDVSNSLAPGLMVLDENNRQLAGSVHLASDTPQVADGLAPQLPSGVLAYVRGHGEDRFTWQPAGGVRLAAVVTSTGGAHPLYVVAARSLREVERREDHTRDVAAAGWVLALAASLAFAWLKKPA